MDYRLLLSLTHELRNPISSALSFAAMLRERMQAALDAAASGSELPRYDKADFQIASGLERGLLRTSRVVKTVFDAALLLNSQFLAETNIAVDLSEILTALSNEISVLCSERPFVLELPPDLPRLKADSARLEQVLSCLLSNANRYTPIDQQVGIRARTHILSADTLETAEELPIEEWLPAGTYVHIEVWDHGPGIPPAEHKRVFQPFYRLSRQPGGSKGTGLGLGLFICQGMVTYHGGVIWITETVGAPHGTTVHVLWPAESRARVAGHGR